MAFRWGTSYADGDAAEHRLEGTLIFGEKGYQQLLLTVDLRWR